jgi:hypothetical protein
MLLTTAAMLAVTTAGYSQRLPRQPGEITPTPEMLTKAKQVFRDICDGTSMGCTYHFNRSNGYTFACAYVNGANGGYGARTTLSDVLKLDEMMKDYCRYSPGDPPHAYTGEAVILGYRCINGRMWREPYTSEFNSDGWMHREWRPLS